MFCKYCGNEIKDGALFCAKCGKRVNEQAAGQSATPTQTTATSGTNYAQTAQNAASSAQTQAVANPAPQNGGYQRQQNAFQQAQNNSVPADLFSHNHFTVECLNSENYDIHDGGANIGHIAEQDVGKKTAGGVAFSALAGVLAGPVGGVQAGLYSDQLLPYKLHIFDGQGNLLSSVSRGVTMMRQKLSIKNAAGQEIATVDSKGSKFKTAKLTVFDSANAPIGTIYGKPDDIKILDAFGNEIGSITNRNEINITGNFSDEKKRISVISTALCIGKILAASGR